MAEERAADSAVRGFVLQATYRVQGAAAVVHLYGALEQGGSFLVRDHRQRPSFHIARDDAEAAWRLGATRQFETANATFDGRRAVRVEVGIPSDAPPLRDRLEAQDVRTFEADVRFATRYLIDRDIRGGCAISGAWTAGEHISRIYDDPVLRPAQVRMAPSVLSFDIETDMEAKRLLAIALYGRFGAGEATYTVDEVLVVDRAGRAMPERAIGFADEKQALAAFAARVRELDPDVLTGWNVVDFDLNVLARIAKRLRVPLHLGRDEGGVRVRPAQGYFGSGQASIPGRVVLDGMDLVRGATSASTTIRWTAWRARCSARGRWRSARPARRATAHGRFWRGTRTTCPPSPPTPARMRDWRWRSWRNSAWSRWPRCAASSRG